jgi:hypothetical protein
VFFNAESAENAENDCQEVKRNKGDGVKLGAWNSARPRPGHAVQVVVKEEVISALSAISALR